MKSARMRRVDEAVREVLADAIPRCVKDPTDRLRDRDGREDQPRPAPRAGLRERARRRGRALGLPRRASRPRTASCSARSAARAADEAHADADLPLRRDGPQRGARLEALIEEDAAAEDADREPGA